MTVFQQNCSAFATTREERIDQLRHIGVEVALEFIDTGMTSAAAGVMLASVEEQAAMAGIRHLQLVVA